MDLRPRVSNNVAPAEWDCHSPSGQVGVSNAIGHAPAASGRAQNLGDRQEESESPACCIRDVRRPIACALLAAGIRRKPGLDSAFKNPDVVLVLDMPDAANFLHEHISTAST